MRRIAIGILLLVAAFLFALPFFPRPVEQGAYRRVGEWNGLNHPMGIAWHRGFLYVADAEAGAVKKFSPEGSLAAEWRGFSRPVAVVAGGDAIYVADFLADRITRLGPDGRVIGTWGRNGSGPGEFDAPSGIAADRAGRVYVTDFYNHRVQKFTADGSLLALIEPFRYAAGVAVDPDGTLYVSDFFENRIVRLAPARAGGR